KDTPESSKGKEKLECLQNNEEKANFSYGESESGRTELLGGCSLSGSNESPNGKRNRNGKNGINKDKKNALSSLASRKTCWNCSSTTHLSFQCKSKSKTVKNDKVL